MDPITLSILLGGGTQALSGILGELASAGDKREQMRLLEQTLAEYEGLTPPELEQLKAEQLGPSAYEGIQSDPRAKEAQYAALAQLQQLARSGGLNFEDRANLSRANAEGARQASAGRAGIAADMAARGQYGGGQQLAMQLSNQQAAANRGAQTGLETAAMAQRRGLDSILEGGRLGGQLRGQDYDEKARAAHAKDLVSRYNADSRSGAARYNAQLPQQQFQNQLQVTDAKARARGAKAGQHGQQADDTRAMAAGVGAGAQRTGTGVANQMSYEEMLKRRGAGGA
jgi:hypothetical protein